MGMRAVGATFHEGFHSPSVIELSARAENSSANACGVVEATNLPHISEPDVSGGRDGPTSSQRS